MAEHILAIDFGTSYSSAAVVVPGGRPVTVETSGPNGTTSMWPSAVFASDTGLLVGYRANAELANGKDPDAYTTAFKRVLGEPTPIVLGEQNGEVKAFAPQDLVRAMIAELKAAAEGFVHAPMGRAVLTVPASYIVRDERRALMIEAAESAGLEPVQLLPEPVAAAFAPELATIKPGTLILVYDFGGGTFDVALIRKDTLGGEVLNSACLERCGGVDLDALLVDKLRADPAVMAWQESRMRAVPPEDRPRLERRLHDDFSRLAREMKHDLTDRQAAEPRRIMTNAPLSRLTRAELNEAAAQLLEDTIECCRAMIGQVPGIDMADIDAVLLVGGTTRMRVVAETLKEAFGRPLRTVLDPDLVVVRGAAEWASTRPIKAVRSLPGRPGTAVLRWQREPAELLRWCVPPGQPYRPGTPLARVRFESGELWEFIAGQGAQLHQVLATEGQMIGTGDWIAVTLT